jgi:glutathione S-transferase
LVRPRPGREIEIEAIAVTKARDRADRRRGHRPVRPVIVTSMRVYHREGAGRPVRIAWVYEELGEPYDLEIMTREEGLGEGHRARHPLGRVPVIEDDDGFIFESAAICLHLADLFPQAALAPPPGTHERALVYQWSVFVPAELEPPLIEAGRQAERDPERAQLARERFGTAAGAVAGALGDGEYLVGDRFTVADVLVSSALAFTRRAGLWDDLPPSLQRYVERMDQRPARQRAVAAIQASPA